MSELDPQVWSVEPKPMEKLPERMDGSIVTCLMGLSELQRSGMIRIVPAVGWYDRMTPWLMGAFLIGFAGGFEVGSSKLVIPWSKHRHVNPSWVGSWAEPPKRAARPSARGSLCRQLAQRNLSYLESCQWTQMHLWGNLYSHNYIERYCILCTCTCWV